MVKNKLSESEEMYLVSVARLNETSGPGPVPLALVASLLGVMPVSANQMVKKLEECGLLIYTPYKGVELTAEGLRLAQRLLRRRRLWSVFLNEHLSFNPQEADEMACRLEHVLPDPAMERLANFLGHPLIAPDGRPIPPVVDDDEDGMLASGVSLLRLAVSQSGLVTAVRASEAIQAFLAAHGIQPGAQVSVQGRGALGDSLVQAADQPPVHLSLELSASIFIHTEGQAPLVEKE